MLLSLGDKLQKEIAINGNKLGRTYLLMILSTRVQIKMLLSLGIKLQKDVASKSSTHGRTIE
jgi:hypothetical protein